MGWSEQYCSSRVVGYASCVTAHITEIAQLLAEVRRHSNCLGTALGRCLVVGIGRPIRLRTFERWSLNRSGRGSWLGRCLAG